MYSVISGSSMILTLLRSARMHSAPMRCSCKGEIADAEEGVWFIGFNDNPFAPPMSPATLAARGAYEKCFGRRRGRVTDRTQVDERSSRCLRGVAVCGLCRRGGPRNGPPCAAAKTGYILI